MMFPLVTAAAVLWTAALPAATSPTASLQDPTPAPAPAAGIPECKDMKKTPSGLEYGVLKEGRKEASPGKDDVVEVHYTGWLTDGTKFDSSRDRGVPTSFGVSEVVKGWTEGLQLMTPGAHFKFVIPAELGYGAQSQGKIPANSTLVFEVELLKVTSMPKFPPAGKDRKDLADGVKYEVTKVGTGAQVSDKVSLAMRYAIWKADGTLLDCSERQNNHRISGGLSTLPFPFLKNLAQTCKVGDVLRAEVPKALFPNAGEDTVWELEVTGVTTLPEMPKFRLLDQSKVVTTQSGLKYEVIEAGTGVSPVAADTVVAHYAGWLLDGTPFDSSYSRGSTSEFPLNRVIKGWTEGLQLMKTGGKFLFEIPGELAYGTRGSPPKIPANATLVFLVELVDVKAAKKR